MTLPWNGPQFQIPALMPQMTGTKLIRVKDVDSAKAYPTSPNGEYAMFEENDDVMYIKTTDANNFPTLRKFRFTEEPIDVPNSAQYVTRDEFMRLKEELEHAQQLIQQSAITADTKSKWNSDQPKPAGNAPNGNGPDRKPYENGKKQQQP